MNLASIKKEVFFGLEYSELKTVIWGIFIPVIVTLLLSSVSAGLASLAFPIIMFIKNGKKDLALETFKYGAGTVACALLLLGLGAGLSVF